MSSEHEFRRQISSFFRRPDYREVPRAITQGLLRRQFPNSRDEILTTTAATIISASVDREVLARVAPKWFDLSGFVQVVSDLTSAPVWNHLFRRADPRVLSELMASAEITDVASLSRGVELSNSRNFARATTNALLGAVVGERVGYVLTPFTVNPPPRPGIEPTIAYDVADEVGGMFRTPAATPQELLERIMELIPDPAQKTGQETLYEKLIKHNTFKRQADDITQGCPAVSLTEVMYNEFGRRLANDQGARRKFLSLVTLGDDRYKIKSSPQVETGKVDRKGQREGRKSKKKKR